MALLLEMISAAVARHPEKPAVIQLSTEKPEEVSYGGLYAGACRTAQSLSRMGLAPGARVVLMGGNSPQWAAACVGIHMAGFTVSGLDPEITDEVLGNILPFLEPQAAVCDSSLTGRFKNSIPNIIELESIDLTPAQLEFKAKPIAGNQPFSIVFTSGSTSTPKGVMLSEKNLLHNIEILSVTGELMRPTDRLLNLLPLYHVYAFTVTLLTPLCVGATVIYPRSLKGKDIMNAARDQQCTIILVVPRVLQAIHQRICSAVKEKSLLKRALFRLLLKIGSLGTGRGFRPGRFLLRQVHRDLRHLRFFASGGARLDPDLHRELAAAGFRILEAYGLSETSPIVSLNTPKRPIPGSVGKAAAGVEIKIERTDPALDDGEVMVRGPNVMMGYFRNPEATGEAIVDGWFRTGDLGRLDEHGNLFLTGRSKEVIVMSSGKNIYPDEIEKIYSKSKLIEEVCICRLEKETREQLTAVVVPSSEARQGRSSASMYENIKSDIKNLNAVLPSYQRVNRVIIAGEPFPRTRLGKLKRYQIQESIKKE